VQYGRISQRGVISLQNPIALPKAEVIDMRFGTWIRMIKSRRTRWAEHGKTRNAYRILVGKPEGKRPLGRP
jgi:hypothetical protein